MDVSRAHSIGDLDRMARCYLPRIAFDFIEGGVEDEGSLARNLEAYRRLSLVPRFLVEVSRRSQSTTLFGRTYDSPLGIAPTGAAGMWRQGADVMLARAAAAANVPFVLASASMETIESVVEAGGKNIWFQRYSTRDPSFSAALIDRARGCGVETLVVTVDVPVTGKRERNLHNGFTRPMKLRPGTVLEAMTHPEWLARYLLAGARMAPLANWAQFAKPGASADEVFAIYGAQTPSDQQAWVKLADIRKLWPGHLVVKGILAPDDAVRAFALGADGVILSNHGGRQLDIAPSPLEVLPLVRAAVGGGKTVMIDSGIRRGTDVLKAFALGADFAFVGRATLYGVIAGAQAGAARALEILRKEIDVNLGMLGCNSLADLANQGVLSRAADRMELWTGPRAAAGAANAGGAAGAESAIHADEQGFAPVPAMPQHMHRAPVVGAGGPVA